MRRPSSARRSAGPWPWWPASEPAAPSAGCRRSATTLVVPRTRPAASTIELQVHDAAVLAAVDHEQLRDLRQQCERGVLSDRQREQQTELLAVLGEQP